MLIDVKPVTVLPGWTVQSASDGSGLAIARSRRGFFERRWIVAHRSIRRIVELPIGPSFSQSYEPVSHLIIAHGLWQPEQPFRSLPPGPIRGSSDSLALMVDGRQRVHIHGGIRTTAGAARTERIRSRTSRASVDGSSVRRDLGDLSTKRASLAAVPRAVGSIVREIGDDADRLILADPAFADDTMTIAQPPGLTAPIAATVLALGGLIAEACGVPLYVTEEWTREPSGGD